MTEDFTLTAYRALVEAFLGRDYSVLGYDDAEAARPHLILRHDLDMSLQAALPVAEIERALGVGATYFVLLRTEMYNPWSAAGREAIGRIASCGHEIGLHLDVSLYDDGATAIDAAAALECQALEALIGQPVRMISLHRPAPALLGRAGSIAGRRHTYEPAFFEEMGYCSDSRGAWHHGHPLDHDAVNEGRAIQLLTHPIWWNALAGEVAVAKLERFADQRGTVLRQELAANCEPYREVQDLKLATKTKRRRL